MIQLGTILKVTDKTGVVLAKCIKVLNSAKNKIAKMGSLIVVTVYWINPKKFALMKARVQKRFMKGTIHRALIVRTKVNYQRIVGLYIKFNVNSIVIVTRNIVPVTNRVYGPILREFCMRWPSLGCVTISMI